MGDLPVIVVSSETEFEQFTKREVCDNNNYLQFLSILLKHSVQ